MSTLALRRATYEDVLAAPAHKVAEVLGGELSLTPRPNFAHAHVTGMLASDLINPFGRGRGGPGGWHILVEPELHLSEDILVPDLGGWRAARFSLDAVAFSRQAPDWICEILSPSTARTDRVLKLPIYLREGVSHAWLIDPSGKTLEVLRATDQGWVLVASFGGTDKVRAAPFDAIELDLHALWLAAPEPHSP